MTRMHGAPLDAHPPDITPATSPPPPGHQHRARVKCLPRLQTRVTRVQVISNHAEPGGVKTPESWKEIINYFGNLYISLPSGYLSIIFSYKKTCSLSCFLISSF